MESSQSTALCIQVIRSLTSIIHMGVHSGPQTERELEWGGGGKGTEDWSLYYHSLNEPAANYFKCAALSQFKGQCWASTL